MDWWHKWCTLPLSWAIPTASIGQSGAVAGVGAGKLKLVWLLSLSCRTMWERQTVKAILDPRLYLFVKNGTIVIGSFGLRSVSDWVVTTECTKLKNLVQNKSKVTETVFKYWISQQGPDSGTEQYGSMAQDGAVAYITVSGIAWVLTVLNHQSNAHTHCHVLRLPA